jgi:hypothetical protein
MEDARIVPNVSRVELTAALLEVASSGNIPEDSMDN